LQLQYLFAQTIETIVPSR